ncbi:MAG: ABC transporter ATP-binding protein/permease [Clostridia bacterium]|nr:ABC transporter ATP-binding protein/permease [Clostridia bacterium]
MSLSPVRIQNAHKYYNKGKDNQLHVMNNVSLELPECGMVAIFGRSGCGKTTLLNAVGGLDRIASGKIELFGKDIREDTDTLRNKYVGYIFQNYNLNINETVFENVSTALRLCGMEDETEIEERTMAALANVEMDKYRDRTPDTLSGGQQQRVAIARALVKGPAIILADEPTGNLDEQNTVLVMDILKALSKRCLVLLVTHEAHLVDHYCDRVIEIVDGEVRSDRLNADAKGYITRDKNHIYLGELEKTATATPGVTVEYYGDAQRELTLQVVSHEGKLYIKVSDPTVKVLDEGSEIKLMEGVFEETPADPEIKTGKDLDLSRFAPFEGKHFGRLYHWRNSLKAAWRENFRGGKKKGKGLLRACLILLAVVMVFMTAAFGAAVRSLVDLRRDHNERLFYIPLNPEDDFSVLNDIAGTHGVDYTRIIGWDPVYDVEMLEFRAATFMTAENIYLSAEARPVSLSLAEDLPLVAGKKDITVSSDIVITTALAQKLLDTATVSYLREPADLIGMVTRGRYYNMGDSNLRIAGVVESDELFFYLDDLVMARYVLNGYFYLPLTYASYADVTVQDGEMILFNDGTWNTSEVKVGQTVTVLGKTFTVSEIRQTYMGIAEYPAYVKDTHGVDLITDPRVYAAQVLGQDELTEQAEYTWLFDHYFEYGPEFYERLLADRPSYKDVSYEEWMIATYQNPGMFAQMLGYDRDRAAAAWLYHEKNAAYPTSEELDAFMSTFEAQNALTVMFEDPLLYREFDRYLNQHYSGSSRYNYSFAVSDADYIALSSCVGKTDEWLGFHFFDCYNYGDGTAYYTNYLLLRSSDTAATEAYLTETLGRDRFLTPEDIFADLYDQIRSGVAVAIVSVLVVLALMCLCVFFIMRSSFMSRVREVGILRAIGVTGKNLTFRFTVETALLLLLTTVPAYILSALFIGSLSDAVLVSTVFYFPAWMAIGLLCVISAVGILFGILPALLLLRKTPSEILSKYDI